MLQELKAFTYYICLSCCFWAFAACQNGAEDTYQTDTTLTDSIPHVSIDLPAILKRGKLIALTPYSSSSYFIYRGEPMGYEYELLTRLADHLDVELEIEVNEDMDHIIAELQQGRADLIAYGMTVTKGRQKKVHFTRPLSTTRQVLVQRLPDNWRKMKRHEIEKALIRNPLGLIGKKVHVRKNSPYFQRLRNLSEEIGGDIHIVTVPGDVETEALIRQVDQGEIDYTVADQNIAMINKTYLPDIDIETPVSFPQRIAWAVRKNSPQLLDTVNAWLEGMQQQTDYYVIYNKYFKNNKAYRARVKSEFFSRAGGKISRYDELIRQHAGVLGWDWRLLASLIYQESQFDPHARSWAGAAGLMQMMPATAREMGVQNPADPAQSIRAGARYLKKLHTFWKERVADSLEAIRFTMASYNVGKGHVLDARRLARKHDDNPEIWNGHVAKWLLKKSNPDYYNDEVVKFGYCRGEEPFHYVRAIMERYAHYKQFIPLET